MKNYYLKAVFAKAAFFAFILSAQVNAQTNYVVESIPYQVYETTTPFPEAPDDTYSSVFEIPFGFTFFGETHNEILMCYNGFISFSTELANTPSQWKFDTTIPNTAFPIKNAILGCYHDTNSTVDNSVATITSSILGEAPNRKFVLAFNNVPQFSCNTEAISTFQIILYETINYIDVQVTKKDLCATWNNGNAVIGIIDTTGTIAYTPPGRNTGAWEITTGEGWRFRTGDTADTPDNLFKNAISLYPNPSSDILNIENTSGKDITDVSIYSVNGMKVKQTTDNKLSVGDLQTGIYIVKVQIENEVMNYKFIKK